VQVILGFVGAYVFVYFLLSAAFSGGRDTFTPWHPYLAIALLGAVAFVLAAGWPSFFPPKPPKMKEELTEEERTILAAVRARNEELGS
jgi:hypothetical protein